MGKYNTCQAKRRLLNRIRGDKRLLRKKRTRNVIGYAAVIVVFLGLGYGYHKLSAPAEEVAHKTISVPNGERFSLELADGTRVHLNSGTILKFPVPFEQNGNREVFMEGEGYFEVMTDRKRPFIVHTDGLNLRVLGTRFTISAYPDEETFHTVLVEGSVELYGDGESLKAPGATMMQPGHIASWQKKAKKMTMEEIDTGLYTGWMDGKLIFNHMPFGDILKKLERNYDVRISNNYKKLDGIRFTASFDTENLEQVLGAFGKNHAFRYFLDGNTVRIEKP